MSDDRGVSPHHPDDVPDDEQSNDSQRLEERLHWIYAATSPDELQQRYDEWAADYDSDLDGMAWAAPQAGADRCAAFAGTDGEVLDAGCGTGLVGVSLHRLGVRRIVGFDLSVAMLARASATGAYAELLQGSLLQPLPFADDRFAGAVSVGVFTHGHVGPAAFADLARVVAPGGHVSMTFRDDAVGPLGYQAEAARLEAIGVWTLVERTEPAPLILEGDVGADMRVWTWRVS
jgi:predicted TPR repeat methyltransferase